MPPTATTLGEYAGYSPGAPLSPVEATKVTPWWPLGVVKSLSNDCSPANSLEPQLIETTETPRDRPLWSHRYTCPRRYRNSSR